MLLLSEREEWGRLVERHQERIKYLGDNDLCFFVGNGDVEILEG